MDKLVQKVVNANMGLSGTKLLNWAMNQLFRAARTIDLDGCLSNHPVSDGCDAAATVILKQLVKTKQGRDLVYMTNPKLLRGYRKP